jgi:23S rRNA (guanosine2251-2'-O)-methyltransferase
MKNTKTKAIIPQDVVFGVHPLIELLTAKKRHVYTIYTTQMPPKAWGQIERLITSKDTIVKHVAKEFLDKLTDSDDHQNVVALVKPLQMRASCFDPKKHPFLILLDSIQDTRNMGAILRSGYCTGVNGVIIPEKNSAPLSGATYKASAGLAEHLDIYRPGSTHQAVLELKKAGYHVYMAALGGKNALEIEYQLPLCLVIGNEATGIASDILKMGEKVTLPQRTPKISYNASVAAGIMLFTIATKSGALK